ncbi:tigger transposable element-derived protein [Plakobranchus ocellatus]|uniref:Tigger transposable element-derived protein n=1 Tax=Plakobranchus ocellatus TaxID=259542 RepID=A0AAV3YTD1_9GAST|nr:tigger transposable element-derived protein [Plakobranchus ocellatus]
MLSATTLCPQWSSSKEKRMPPELQDGAPSSSIVTCTDNSWIDSTRFSEWLRHFVQHTKPTVDRKLLFILDGHKTHTKNLEAITFAKENNVILLSLPPHTTHKTQPLDRTFFNTLQTF